MSHARKQIRVAVESLLSDSPVNWQRVFDSRLSPQRDVLPYLNFYVESEVTQPQTIHPGFIQSRVMALVINGRTRIVDGEEIENALDTMAEEIEQKITFDSLNALLGGKLKSIYLDSSASSFVEDERERTFAEIAL
ncbi:MAG: hypothetical protein GY755_15370, partial [Chloroflexi bacterium]|nr:hypothetical protein [Chloroflexota bacterium]